MVASEKPPPPTSSSTPYVIGAVVLAVLAFGLYRWKSSSNESHATPQVVTVTATATQNDVPVLDAPPPPPKLEDLPDAGDDAGAKGPAKASGGGSGGCGGKCDNTPSPALQSALRGAAQSAQGCYQRALRTGEVSGNMTVTVQVGPNGSVCSAGIAVDNVHSNEVTQCVLGRFRGRQFPPPGNGCSTVNIPLNFVAK